MWVLVIMLLAGSDGGRALNVDLRYLTADDCHAARVKIYEATKGDRWPPITACVPADQTLSK